MKKKNTLILLSSPSHKSPVHELMNLAQSFGYIFPSKLNSSNHALNIYTSFGFNSSFIISYAYYTSYYYLII